MLVFNEARHARSSRAEASPEVVLLSARVVVVQGKVQCSRVIGGFRRRGFVEGVEQETPSARVRRGLSRCSRRDTDSKG